VKKASGILSILIFILISGFVVSAENPDDAQRVNKLLNTTSEQLDKIAEGTLPWPEYFFPISTWSKEEIKEFPDGFLDLITKKEKEWPVYIDNHRKLFQKEYGYDVKNNYDLFLKEVELLKMSDKKRVGSYVTDNKTLSRLTDKVIIKGENFDKLQGTPLDNIRVFSHRRLKLRAIPFDIVEFTEKNKIVLPEGSEGNPEDGDKVFSANDKLFFMAIDAGDKVDLPYFNTIYANLKEIVEVKVFHPETKEVGWVYVASFEKEPPELSSFDYVVWNNDEAMFYTPYAFLQFNVQKKGKKYEPTFIPATTIGSPAIGAIPLDINKELKLNVYTKYRLGSISATGKDFDTHLRAWFDGKVMLYVRATWKMKSPLGIGAPVVIEDVVLDYLSAAAINSFYTPFNPSLFVKYNEILGGFLYNDRLELEALKGKGRLITSSDREGFIMDGEMSEKEIAWESDEKREAEWSAALFPSGSLLGITAYNDYLEKAGKYGLNWSDDSAGGTFYQDYINFDKFPNRQEYLYNQWTPIPNFSSNELNWENLDLVLKCTEKPLHIKVEGKDEFVMTPFFHVPDIKSVKKHYKY